MTLYYNFNERPVTTEKGNAMLTLNTLFLFRESHGIKPSKTFVPPSQLTLIVIQSHSDAHMYIRTYHAKLIFSKS